MQVRRRLRRGPLPVPRPEVGAAPRRPRAAEERHGGGRLRGGTGPDAGPGAVWGPLLQDSEDAIRKSEESL